MAVKLLLGPAASIVNPAAAADAALSTPNPILSNLQEVGFSRRGPCKFCAWLLLVSPSAETYLDTESYLLCTFIGSAFPFSALHTCPQHAHR